MIITTAVLVFILAVATAIPAQDPVILKLGSGLRYQYLRDSDGTPHLVDRWLKASDIVQVARYNPDLDNVYHLFTRQNPSLSQPLLLGNYALLSSSNFNPNRRTIYLLHGWQDSATGNSNSVMTAAFLQAEDVNVIVVDWSVGASVLGYGAFLNAIASGESGARFIDWLNSMTGASLAGYHIAGYSLGAHQAGFVGRNLNGNVPYITALDPGNIIVIDPEVSTDRSQLFLPEDGLYTEAIHTNAGFLGYGYPLAQTDFYPNGGVNMPGCASEIMCDHDRSFFFFAESITSGGFTGRECATYEDARAGTCDLPATLQMGGLTPKIGSTGMYHLETNASPPFSQG